jgi:hypothetical protein
VGDKLKEVILKQDAQVKVVGHMPSFRTTFTADENNKMISAVNAATPDILLVSLTATK